MSAPVGGISSLALVGGPPEHRDHRGNDEASWFGVDIDPTALVEAFAHVDAGTFQPTRIGARTWIMKGVHVGHDCQVGADCEIAPNTSLGGECVIEDGVRIGQCATTKPRVTIGAGTLIGAGAVVTKDVPAGEVWVGNPARRLVKMVDYGDGCDIGGEQRQRAAARYRPEVYR